MGYQEGPFEAQVSREPVPGRFVVCVDVDSRREDRPGEAVRGAGSTAIMAGHVEQAS